MPRPIVSALAAASLFVLGVYATPACSQTLVATYLFNDTFAAEEAGAPALTSIDPLGLNGFETAVVNGQNQRVFRWDGDGSDPTQHAGLQLDATNLVSYNNYSVEIVFEFTEQAQFGGGWERIMDTQNRQSDIGFYVSPDDVLQVFPVVDGTTTFTRPGFHTVLLTNFVQGGVQDVKAYLDGNLELTSNTDQLNLDNANNPEHLLHFFVDNLVGGSELEFADGRIASLRIYRGIVVPVPAPSSFAVFGLAMLGTAGMMRFRRKK